MNTSSNQSLFKNFLPLKISNLRKIFFFSSTNELLSSTIFGNYAKLNIEVDILIQNIYYLNPYILYRPQRDSRCSVRRTNPEVKEEELRDYYLKSGIGNLMR
ncbi:hypothetical protein RCL_jg21392.t1 [Rhizophagus clarus]|uniref:Uncharacterized protein n=1 Tax=Rhizophagus clarus TaxID=94130 RepID=A0A8H3QY42_9GLOM|nr:hypothetical protein RCL_jg21392.t1 [Rhizophagus clarus]